jgi:DNA ligase-associated metallophosphoesterase
LLNKDELQQQSYAVKFANIDFIMDGGGILFWPARSLLIVSDLHLEKGSYFASMCQPLPVYDTLDTLNRLQIIIEKYQPEHVVALGDNMHDAKALQRMMPQDLAYLKKLCSSVNQWSWIVGNHDKDDYSTSVLSGMNFYNVITIDNIVLSHDYCQDVEYQIIGHYHPKISVKTKIRGVNGKCFVVTDNKILMPAFGSYTGGLDVKHAVLNTLISQEKPKYFIIHQAKIWRVKAD